MKYPIVRNYPVARFYYKGHHSHPVRRTVLLIECKNNYLRGYELREGSISRPFKKAPIKSYSRRHIAKYVNCDKRLKNLPKELNKTTLTRMSLQDLILRGT